MHACIYRSIIIGCLMSLSLHGLTPLIPYTKGEQIAIIHHENEYRVVSPLMVEQTAPLYDIHKQTHYTIEEDTIVPHVDGYLRTIVAVHDGEFTLLGIPLYRHQLTITENTTADSRTRVIKTRIVYQHASVVLLTILACGLAGIVYKVAQKVQDTYAQSQSTHA